VAVDALGNPLRILLRPGQKADISEAEALIEGYRFGALIADKGFDSNDFIEQVESLEAVVVIPPRKNRLVQRDIDRNLYADRNKIERFFGRIKHYRRIATRYEKTARSYMNFLASGLNHDVAALIVHTT
jgi:putative transposase